MKELKGTEKQIAWANKIVEDNMEILKREVSEFKERETRENCSYKILTDKIEKAIVEIEKSEYTAAWWIEHRGLATAYLQKIKR